MGVVQRRENVALALSPVDEEKLPAALEIPRRGGQSSKTVALSVRCAARSALGDTAPRPAGKYGGLDTIKSRLSLSNGALR